MRMFKLPNDKYINPLQVSCCYITQLEKEIFQSVFEVGERKILVSHNTFEGANKDVLDFVKFCEEN
jgi:hypothetical protein